MAKTARNNRIKRDRRKALQTLRMIYPGWMDGEELFLILLDTNPQYSRTLLVRDGNYLHEKGYLRYRGNAGIDVHSISVQHCEFKLTAAGTEVADRLVDDATLDI